MVVDGQREKRNEVADQIKYEPFMVKLRVLWSCPSHVTPFPFPLRFEATTRFNVSVSVWSECGQREKNEWR